MAKKSTDEKRYYTISEVARLTGLEPYVLRYWEKEFTILRPRKNRGGNRLYTTQEIDLVNRINHLRHKEKLTIAGTRARLMMKRAPEEQASLKCKARRKTLIAQLKRDVEDMLKMIE